MIRIVLAAALGLMASGAAFAADTCAVPQTEW